MRLAPIARRGLAILRRHLDSWQLDVEGRRPVPARTIALPNREQTTSRWVISGHFAVQSSCPLYPRKRT